MDRWLGAPVDGMCGECVGYLVSVVDMSITERLQVLYEKWFLWHLRERVYTSIRPDLGTDDTTSSGFVELSRKVKDG